MSNINSKVTFEVVTRIPQPRGYSKKILDMFLEQEHPLVKVSLENRTAKQLSVALGGFAREHREYTEKIKVSCRGEEVYLEKTQSLKGSTNNG